MDTKNGATFIRHNEYYDVDKKSVEAEIVILIKMAQQIFDGRMSSFDWMCTYIVYDLKQ